MSTDLTAFCADGNFPEIERIDKEDVWDSFSNCSKKKAIFLVVT